MNEHSKLFQWKVAALFRRVIKWPPRGMLWNHLCSSTFRFKLPRLRKDPTKCYGFFINDVGWPECYDLFNEDLDRVLRNGFVSFALEGDWVSSSWVVCVKNLLLSMSRCDHLFFLVIFILILLLLVLFSYLLRIRFLFCRIIFVFVFRKFVKRHKFFSSLNFMIFSPLSTSRQITFSKRMRKRSKEGSQ